jgi:hypothetical protein
VHMFRHQYKGVQLEFPLPPIVVESLQEEPRIVIDNE